MYICITLLLKEFSRCQCCEMLIKGKVRGRDNGYLSSNGLFLLAILTTVVASVTIFFISHRNFF